MKIKFVDLASQNEEIQSRVAEELAEIHRHTAYIGGPHVSAFEQEFADFLGCRRVVGVGSGTDALRLTLLALGVGPGDEVITTPMTFIATIEAVLQTGATPVFVDIDEMTGNISPDGVRRYLKAGKFRTANGPKAILPVHLYGRPVDIVALRELADEYRVHLVEDACQAHGARLLTENGWRSAGTFGAAGCFSFYPGKNLGAWGEAGAVATDDAGLADHVLSLRDHGRMSHYAHDRIGYNARLDAVQAAVLRAKLERLPAWNGRRREIAAEYRELLHPTSVTLPYETEGIESCYHLFVIRSDERDRIRQALLSNDIECGIHYPLPLHLQPACTGLGHKPGDFPASEKFADRILSLPMHPHLARSDVARIARVVADTLAEKPVSLAGGHHRGAHAATPLANGN
jgi:dTDP-4-amino-4,6-dideoxygalactose transaminase